MKYASTLTEDEAAMLKAVMSSNVSARLRSRAHCVILSAKRYSIREITDILEVNRRTISSWIDAWEISGFEGLCDKPRSGRPTKLTSREKKMALKLIGEHPKSFKKVMNTLTERTGKTVSVKTLKRLVNSSRMVQSPTKRG